MISSHDIINSQILNRVDLIFIKELGSYLPPYLKWIGIGWCIFIPEARRLSSLTPSYIIRNPSDRQRSYTIAVRTGSVLDEAVELELQELNPRLGSGRPSMVSGAPSRTSIASPNMAKKTVALVTPANPNLLTIPLPGQSRIQPSRSCPAISMEPKWATWILSSSFHIKIYLNSIFLPSYILISTGWLINSRRWRETENRIRHSGYILLAGVRLLH